MATLEWLNEWLNYINSLNVVLIQRLIIKMAVILLTTVAFRCMVTIGSCPTIYIHIFMSFRLCVSAIFRLRGRGVELQNDRIFGIRRRLDSKFRILKSCQKYPWKRCQKNNSCQNVDFSYSLNSNPKRHCIDSGTIFSRNNT